MEQSNKIRIEAIDILRGLVIVLMALDHTRDFFSSGAFNPRDVHQPVLFLTRWITHLCAPVFIFLGGVSIFLLSQKSGVEETSRFIIKRGLWIIFLEFTLVKFGWMFNLYTHLYLLQVIWVIGISLVAMAALIYIPGRYLLALSLFVIVTHNMLDGIKGESLGSLNYLWLLLHEPGIVQLSEQSNIFIVYPMIPWIFVMALGYSFMDQIKPFEKGNMRYLLYAGGGAIVLFILLRYSNVYGDPASWKQYDDLLPTLLSFIDCEKYPPSLLYLLMTLGPAMILLYWFSQKPPALLRPLATFGNVPLFFYIIHLPVIHMLALLTAYLTGSDTNWLFIDPFFAKPEAYGHPLYVTYIAWLIACAILYPVMRRFSQFKRTKRPSWTRYM